MFATPRQASPCGSLATACLPGSPAGRFPPGSPIPWLTWQATSAARADAGLNYLAAGLNYLAADPPSRPADPPSRPVDRTCRPAALSCPVAGRRCLPAD
jgi:hypothetical protein